MGISKDIIKRCIRDKRDEIEAAEIISRPFSFVMAKRIFLITMPERK